MNTQTTISPKQARLEQLRRAKRLIRDTDAQWLRNRYTSGGLNIFGDHLVGDGTMYATSVYVSGHWCSTKRSIIAAIEHEIEMTEAVPE